jgi:hypothetical protein
MVDLDEVLIFKLSSSKPEGGPSLVTSLPSLPILPGGHTHEGEAKVTCIVGGIQVPRADRRRFWSSEMWDLSK